MKKLPLLAALAALSFAPAMAGANSNGLQLLDGLSPNQLSRISKTLGQDPNAYDSLISVGKCAQRTLSKKELEDFRAFAETASHNVRKYCDDDKKQKAADYAEERFGEYRKTKSYKALSSCVKNTSDAQGLSQLIMAQMGIPSTRMDESSICKNFGK